MVKDSRVTPWLLAFSEPLSEKFSSDKDQTGGGIYEHGFGHVELGVPLKYHLEFSNGRYVCV